MDVGTIGAMSQDNAHFETGVVPNAEGRFRALFENPFVGVELVGADGRLIEVNRRLRELLGFERDEMLGMHFEELSHPDDVAAERAQLQRLTAGEASSYRMEKRALLRDGGYLWVEICSSVDRDQAGRWTHRTTVTQDISDRKREAERAARYEALCDQSPFGIVLIDPTTGGFVEFNDQAHRMLGYSRAEFAELTLADVETGSRPEAIAARNAEILAAGEGCFDVRHATRAGEVRDVLATFRAVQIEGRRLLQSVWQEVGGLRRAAEDRARHDALIRQIISSSPLPMGIVEVREDDGDVFHVYDNPATSRFFGMSRGATSGRWDHADLGVPKATVETWIAAYRGSQRLKHPVLFEDRHTHDGAERWLGVVVSYVGRHANGRDRFCYISEDITERKHAEEEIRRLNRSLERRATELMTLIEVLPIGIGIAEDPACRSIRVNPLLSELLRLPRGSNASLTASEDERPRDFKIYRDGRELRADELPMQRAAATGVTQRDVEVDIVFNDGTVLNLLENVAPLFDESGRPRGCVGAYLDVTERRKVEAERERLLVTLREDDRRKDEFLAMLAHELRNPLAAVSNAVQVLQLKGTADPDLQWSFDVIERQAGHLSRLLDDLLDVSRISSGKVTLRFQTIDVREVIRRAAETTRPLIEKQRHTLELGLPDEPLHASADPARLEQIVVNLVSNAAKYSEEGRTIAVVGGREDDDVVVRVVDQGVGIPPEILGRIFDLFAQADTSIDRSQGGLGIGLTIVKSLVEMHGGSVTAISKGSGRGSEFVVRLPALDSIVGEADASELAAASGSRPQRIVVVDDNVDANQSVRRVLASFGHEVKGVHNGITALDVIDAFRPGVVLLDIGLPGMNGYEVADRLRRRPYGQGLLLIAVTGYGQESDRRRSREAGIDYHMVKPIDFEALRAIIDGRAPTGVAR